MRNPRKTILALLPTALSIARATFARGRLTSVYRERTYLAVAGLVLALLAAALKRRIEA